MSTTVILNRLSLRKPHREALRASRRPSQVRPAGCDGQKGPKGV